MKLALASTLLVSAAAFSPEKKPAMPNVAAGLAAGAIATATLVPLPQPAMAADSLVLGTPLESKLANFGAASYSVFNSVSDLNPLAEKFVSFIDAKVKPADAAAVAQKAADGILAIPDAKVSEYAGVLKTVVYSGVNSNNCVTLSGSGAAAKTLAKSAAISSIDKSKVAAISKKFASPNKAVPTKGGDICLPGSVAASEKLWVAQAELTFSMPKSEATALIGAIRGTASQATRPAIATLVGQAESTFSKSPEAIRMAAAGKAVEPEVIATASAAIR